MGANTAEDLLKPLGLSHATKPFLGEPLFVFSKIFGHFSLLCSVFNALSMKPGG